MAAAAQITFHNPIFPLDCSSFRHLYNICILVSSRGSLTSSYSFVFRLSGDPSLSRTALLSPSKRATALAWLDWTWIGMCRLLSNFRQTDLLVATVFREEHALSLVSLLGPPSSSELLRVLSTILRKFPALRSLLPPSRRLHAATLPKPERPPSGPTPDRALSLGRRGRAARAPATDRCCSWSILVRIFARSVS